MRGGGKRVAAGAFVDMIGRGRVNVARRFLMICFMLTIFHLRRLPLTITPPARRRQMMQPMRFHASRAKKRAVSITVSFLAAYFRPCLHEDGPRAPRRCRSRRLTLYSAKARHRRTTLPWQAQLVWRHQSSKVDFHAQHSAPQATASACRFQQRRVMPVIARRCPIVRDLPQAKMKPSKAYSRDGRGYRAATAGRARRISRMMPFMAGDVSHDSFC